MAGKDLIVDPAQLDLSNVIADVEEIRKYNPQRHEMEQLTGILLEDAERHVCVGFKELTREEFWVRGHMPGMPLMPGVVMCEAAAQLCCYYAHKYDLLKTKVVGFGGLEEVRFRGPVIPGDCLVLACELLKLRPKRMLVCRFQGFVRETLVVNGMIRGIPLPVDSVSDQRQ